MSAIDLQFQKYCGHETFVALVLLPILVVQETTVDMEFRFLIRKIVELT